MDQILTYKGDLQAQDFIQSHESRDLLQTLVEDIKMKPKIAPEKTVVKSPVKNSQNGNLKSEQTI